MKRFSLLLFCLLLIFLAACSARKQELSTETKLKMADELYAKKKYAKAAVIYDEISFERKSAATAYATLRQAESYYALHKFVEARLKYQQFIDGFPDHENIADAYYRIGQCLFEESYKPDYDQYETMAAIEAFRNFVDRFPTDVRYMDAVDYIQRAQYKMIEKKYQSGYIYYKMKDYSAALMYFEEVTALGNTDKLDKMSLYYSSLLHLHQKNRAESLSTFERLQRRYPDSKQARKLAKKLAKHGK